ncbi:aldose 1-epimerase [Secundilactobacillus pentosiphilus]|uniref:Maltose epimerase n=1 Tax=Secundilactobacillus pentosiphilus TaxID=1714682 RepID=A0A1Z5IRA6_9LACO|nr:aldose epimerase family protein [Secundilactobacillus pentosiphilus]GAX03961.1 aldose 1-epimerase [Secundilactobacillus pentosiphilus]
MPIKVARYQRKGQHDYCEITMVNRHGMQVKLLNYGATLEKVLIPTARGLENVIMSLESPEDYSKARNFLGGTVGRVVGRIRHGQWQHGNHIVQLPLNDGQNHIHGGTGTDTQIFEFSTQYDEHQSTATFILFDADGNNGYPGNLKLQVSYTLDDDNQLTYRIRAISDKMTIFNPTNHVYFRLNGPQSDVLGLNLQLNSDTYLPLDADSLPYQGRRSVEGTVFDFRRAKSVGAVINSHDSQIDAERGLNHPFLLRGDSPAAVLSSPDKKRTVVMTTKSPAIVVYTGNHFDHTGIAKNLGQYNGITLEAQMPPAAGSDLTAITLLPGEQFDTWTKWQFTY